MPEDTDRERRPKLRMIYMKDASLGGGPGFKKIEDTPKGPEATYVNLARLQFEHPEPFSPKNEKGEMERNDKIGGWYMWRVTDFDHGHKMVLFLSERRIENKETNKVEYSEPYVVKDLRNHIREIGLSEENWSKFLFEIGKTDAKAGSQGKWFVRLVSTTADTPGMFDDPTSTRFKDAFELSKAEEAIIAKINSLVEASGLPKEFTKDMFMTTFVSGAAGPPTTQKRADVIWGMAKTNPEKTKLHPDIIKAIVKIG